MASSLKNTIVNDTGYLTLPVGTTEQRSPAIFTSSGSWTCPTGVTSVQALIVAGGGGGGFNGGGGGGAGGLVYNSSVTVVPGTVYTITVGNGGAGSSTSAATGSNGTNSSISGTGFSTITAIGGGGGNSRSFAGTIATGGSGGGGGGSQASASQAAGPGTASQGNAGGIGTTPDAGTSAAGGGGGGAGAVGTAASSLTGGKGGNGLSYSISGIPVIYAGGGGGGCTSPTAGTPGVGGDGGGGRGGAGSGTIFGYAGQPGALNTGSGGGGAGGGLQGGTGSSGIVIINWAPSVNVGTIRFNSATKKVESNTGNRDKPSLGTSGWVTDGLACLLDAGDVRSYPGVGNIWYDISGNNRDFYINTSYAAWTAAGTSNSTSYFTISGNNNASREQFAFIGPASDTWGFGQDHYFEFILNGVADQVNQLFMFSPNGNNQDRIGAQNILQSHWRYNNGNTYYDVYGCCDGKQRVVFPNSSWNANGVIQHAAYRTRTSEYPNRQVFKNTSSIGDSGQMPTDTAIWDKNDPVILCGGTSLKIYYVAIYNRALTDGERASNFATLQSRYGIT